jgi:hypothetical protein
MDCTTALIVVAAAGLVFIGAGIYAAHRNARWMANYDTQNKGTKE